MLAAACSSHRTGTVDPATTGQSAVEQFLQAAADSNLSAMAALWGTSRGPSSATNQPPDYFRRIAVMQAYLKPNHYRVVQNLPVHGRDDQRVVEVEFSRSGCTRTVPITTIRTGQGQWLVYQFDLALIGSPGKPCQP